MEPAGRFADATASLEEARYVLCGVPFDRTTSFRPGARFGPDAIRQQSWNFESYDLATGFDLADIPVHDLGNAPEYGSAAQMVDGVRAEIRSVVKAGKVPITLGGDHACAPPCVEAFPEDAPLGVLYLDAHLDFRASYLGDPRSHACSSRRMLERVGAENIVVVGVRSVSREEIEDNRAIGMSYIPAEEVATAGIQATVRRALAQLVPDRVYVTLDIDVVDPAFAGATGTPEPFGLSAREVKLALDEVAPRLAGFDVMEVAPHYDQGNTAGLAARLVREVIVRSWAAQHRTGRDRPA